MRLARLRTRMLLAMGLPACWTASTTAPPPAPTVVVPPRPAQVAEFDPDRCARDTIPETVCGVREEEATKCGARGDSIESIEESALHVTRYGSRATFRDFVFDLGATQGYRDRLQGDGDVDVDGMCCFSRCTPLVVAQTAAPATPSPGYHLDERCIPPPPGGTNAPEATNRACPAAVELDKALRPYANGGDETCCYTTIEPDRRVIRGRAIRIDGEPAAAPVDALAAWRSGTLAPALDMTADARARLADAWLDGARMEHASIAAFSMLSLRLLALGAPPDLIARTHAAALDEIEHARLAFDLASAYAGAPLGPAPFTEVSRAPASCDLATLAVETLIDGCWNETVASLEAELAAERAQDPVVAAVLAKIADDEARHAELAFAILRWCVEREPSIAGALHAAIERDVAAVAHRDDALESHGVLGDATLAALRADVLSDVVRPCLAAIA